MKIIINFLGLLYANAFVSKKRVIASEINLSLYLTQNRCVEALDISDIEVARIYQIHLNMPGQHFGLVSISNMVEFGP